ncbi:MAG: transposase [Actinobacteria bacterium]|nr:transposase [Actinomycetota bacterium]
MLPWAHGHQLKGITTFVGTIIENQTGIQAALARGLGNQEAAVKRLSRLLHNARLAPQRVAEAVLAQALGQLPPTGKVRLAIDGTSEGAQYLLVVALITGGRAVPIYWGASDAAVLKGRMPRSERAVLRRVLTRGQREIGPRRVLVTADRGFADVALVEVLTEQGVEFILRVKGSTEVYFQGQWRPLRTLSFAGNTRWRTLGRRAYCGRAPHRLWVRLSRMRDHRDQGDTWYLLANRCRRAQATAAEYARRFGCEQGFRDTKWELGFAQARIKAISAWSRLFALFALALWGVGSLAMKLLAAGGSAAVTLLRRVASRRRGRWDLSIVSAMVRLLQENKDLLAHLSSHMQFNLSSLST